MKARWKRWLQDGCLAATVAFGALASTHARAGDSPKVAFSGVSVDAGRDDVRGDPKALADQLSDEVREKLSRDHVLVSAEGCVEMNQPCSRAQRAAGGPAPHVLRVRLSAQGGDRRVRVQLWDVAAKRAAADFDEVCELCGQAELDEFVQNTAGMIVAKVHAVRMGPATLDVDAAPGQGTVWIDGRRVGRVPWTGEVEAGPHRVEVRRSGYLTARREIDVEPGGTEDLDVQMIRDPLSRSRSLRIAGWSTLGTGALTSVTGAVLWGLDGQPHVGSCDDPDAEGRCPNVYASRRAGITLTAIGMGTIAIGGGLLTYERIERGKTKWRANLRPGLRRLTLQVEF